MLNCSPLVMFTLYSSMYIMIAGNQQISEHVGDQLGLCWVKYELQLKIILSISLFWALIPIILTRWHVYVYLVTGITYLRSKIQTIPHVPPPLHTKIRAIVIFLVGIIDIPIPSFPERSRHFIKEFTLRSSAQHQLPQTLLLGRRLLPQLLLVTRLAGENTKIQQHCSAKNSPLWGKQEALKLLLIATLAAAL